MSDYKTTAQVELDINGKKAEDTLKSLKERAFELSNAIAKAASSGDKIELKKLRKELNSTNRDIRNIESATQQVETIMLRLDKASPMELKRTLNTLNNQLQRMERGTQLYNEQVQKIKQVNAELLKVKSSLSQNESFLSKMNRKFNDWGMTITTAVASFAGVIFSAKQAVQVYADMEGEMANVRKFTGMTAQEVDSLNESFKRIDTRTSRQDLNKLAEEAGKLGKSSEKDVLGFVNAANQINVALDDLGEGATLSISKLTDIFGDEKIYGTEKSMLKVGSVINELSQNCTASAPYLSEFAQRLAGVGAQAKLTIPEIMSFGAVLDSQGQNVEASATALSQLIMKMFQDPAKIAKATGMDLEKFNSTLKTSTNDAILMLLSRLKELGGMDVLAPVFKDMGADGARASQVISALAGNINTVKVRQLEANKAFKEGTSVSKEYEIQNNTVQAKLDKAKKNFTEKAYDLGNQLLPVMKYAISGTSAMMRALSSTISFIIEYKKEIIVLSSAILAYTIAANLAAIKTKGLAAAHIAAKVVTEAWTIATQGAAVVTALFTGNLHKAKQEFIIFSALIKTSPIGLLVGVITAVAGAIWLYTQRTDGAIKAQEDLNKIKEEAAERLVDEKNKIELLRSAAKDEFLSLKDRHKAIDELNKIIPNYNAQLDDTTGKYKENKKELDNYLGSLAKKYELEGAKDLLAEIGKKIAKARIEYEKKAKEYQQTSKAYDDLTKSDRSIQSYKGVGVNAGANTMITISANRLNEAKEDLKELEKERNVIFNAFKNDLQQEAIDSITTSNKQFKQDESFQQTSNTASSDKFEVEKEWKAKEEALNRITYATGAKNYEDYTKRIDEIAVEFYKRQLDHSDLSASEKLQINADYHDALQKQESTKYQLSLDQELQSYNESLAETKQFYIDGAISYEAYEEQISRLELIHLKNIISTTKKGSKERIKAEADYKDALFEKQKKRQDNYLSAEKKHQADLVELKKRVFGNSPAENQKLYDDAVALLQEQSGYELELAQDSADEKLRIMRAYYKELDRLRKEHNPEKIAPDDQGGSDVQDGFKKHLFQFKDWLNTDGGEALKGSLGFVANDIGSLFQASTQLVQAELEIQTAAIQKRYDTEISAAEGNNYKVKKLEQKRDKEIAKAKSEANKKMFAMQVIQAVAQTAMAALNAYSSTVVIPIVGPSLAPAAMALALVTGAIQIAAIKKQQQASEAQGYYIGGYTKKSNNNYEEVGVVHANEWVASSKLLESPVARPVIEALDYAQRNNTIGSLKQSDVSKTINISNSPQNNGAIAESMKNNSMILASYVDVIKKLTERLNEPFVTVNTITGDNGIKKAQDEYNKLISNKSPKKKHENIYKS